MGLKTRYCSVKMKPRKQKHLINKARMVQSHLCCTQFRQTLLKLRQGHHCDQNKFFQFAHLSGYIKLWILRLCLSSLLQDPSSRNPWEKESDILNLWLVWNKNHQLCSHFPQNSRLLPQLPFKSGKPVLNIRF
mgnify:CR=1 FL=1